jgi:arginine deiminase
MLNNLSPENLSKALITGVVEKNGHDIFIFPPIPNLVFTRDIGVTIKDHILLSKTAKLARKRESILAKYIFYFELFKEKQEYVIEISEDSDFFLEDIENQKNKIVTIEGGDIMMISPNHLIVGCSERTSPCAVDKIIHKIFSIKSLEIEYISVMKIKEAREQMHIDTIFTQISRENWVLHPKFSERLKFERDSHRKNYSELLRTGKDELEHKEVEILQFFKHRNATYDASKNYIYKESSKLKGMEDFLVSISIRDFGVKESEVKIVYSGDNEFPYSEREQWTDSCNLLALKNGVVIGYDRNERTAKAFREKLNYETISSGDLIQEFEDPNGKRKPENLSNTLILLPSSELSRARGGSHCMSMPLLREDIKVIF